MTQSLPQAPPLPNGFRLQPDVSLRMLDDTTMFGGSPSRAMRLSAAGMHAWRELQVGPVTSAAAGALARRLTDAGLAHPVPPVPESVADCTIVVPVRDRAAMLSDCLAALGDRYPVVVVDDGSRDPASVAAVCARHSARLVVRPENGGPGPARNTGLAAVTTELVAFVDSDCLAGTGWIDVLAAHLLDPTVAAAAPRIAATRGPGLLGRYVTDAGVLDLGGRPARVVPATLVAYVPTAAVVMRMSALDDVAAGGAVFDPALRYGEDVDLVWRLHEAGWRIRYDPSVQVGHREPASWSELLERRYRYGTSAAALDARHPGSVAPIVLHPSVTVAAAGIVTRRPLLALAGYCTAVLQMRRVYRRTGLPAAGAGSAMADAVLRTWAGLGRYGIQFALPVLAAGVLRGRGRTRFAAVSALLGSVGSDYLRSRPGLDPVRFGLARIVDESAYGTGVIAGSLRRGSFSALKPRVAWRPLRRRR